MKDCELPNTEYTASGSRAGPGMEEQDTADDEHIHQEIKYERITQTRHQKHTTSPNPKQ